MTETGLTNEGMRLTKRLMRGTTLIAAASVAVLAVGCVNVSAPDKPIEINLNINVKQEVVVKLDGQAKELIKDNPGIF